MNFTLRWSGRKVEMVDQTLLPNEHRIVVIDTCAGMCKAIRDLVVRGAPAIGVAAAMGIALAAFESAASRGADSAGFLADLEKAAGDLNATRPTAVNLRWALERGMTLVRDSMPIDPMEAAELLAAEAQAILEADIECNRAMGAHGASLVSTPVSILTHCNAGALATGGYGTALGVIRSLHEKGLVIHVLVDETRPVLQGSRLTAWELTRDGIPCSLICDNMAAHFMKAGRVDLVVTGADRIAANGDTANKIGTYGLSVLARAHGIPMYIAAPLSTIDPRIPDGSAIPIEERDHSEITTINGRRIAPEGIECLNPAFDVTPHGNISAIITEAGVLRPPYEESIRDALSRL